MLLGVSLVSRNSAASRLALWWESQEEDPMQDTGRTQERHGQNKTGANMLVCSAVCWGWIFRRAWLTWREGQTASVCACMSTFGSRHHPPGQARCRQLVLILMLMALGTCSDGLDLSSMLGACVWVVPEDVLLLVAHGGQVWGWELEGRHCGSSKK